MCSTQGRVPRGSVVKCLTRNPGVLGSGRTRSSGFFVGMSFVKTLQSPSLIQVKPREDINNVSYRRNMTENTVESGVKHHSINQPKDETLTMRSTSIICNSVLIQII